LPPEQRGALACTNIIENVMDAVRRVCRKVKHGGSPSMNLRWTGAAMLEAGKGFRRLKACKQVPLLRAAAGERKAVRTSAKPRLCRIGRYRTALNEPSWSTAFKRQLGYLFITCSIYNTEAKNLY
jgi:hypothetical protein